jgi:hypothetical protein
MSEISTVVSSNQQRVVTPLPDGNVLVIAEQPGEMQAAQEALIAWAGNKVAQVRADLADAEQALDSATACGVKLHGVRKLVKSARDSLAYYEKVKSALEDGYCIVPDFPVDIVAIRTMRDWPTESRTETSGWKPECVQAGEVLPEGEGQFVSPNPAVQWCGNRDEKNAKGEITRSLDVWKATEFKAVGLPVKFMKPRVLQATQIALVSKIFDEIGILPASPKKDPLIVGRIIDPKGRPLSFLISWFVDSRDL